MRIRASEALARLRGGELCGAAVLTVAAHGRAST